MSSRGVEDIFKTNKCLLGSFFQTSFLRSGYPLSFIDKLFIKRPQLAKDEKKTLFLSLPYFGETSLHEVKEISQKFTEFLKTSNCF